MFEKQEQCPCSGLKADIGFVAVEKYYFEIEISFSYQPDHVLLCFLKALMQYPAYVNAHTKSTCLGEPWMFLFWG